MERLRGEGSERRHADTPLPRQYQANGFNGFVRFVPFVWTERSGTRTRR
jgi:hypothetical protein